MPLSRAVNRHNKTKYFRLHLSDEVSTERPETDLRLTWDWPEKPQTDLRGTSDWPEADLRLIWDWDWPETDLRLTWDWPETDLRLTWDWPETDLKLTWDWPETDLKSSLGIWCQKMKNKSSRQVRNERTDEDCDSLSSLTEPKIT